MSGVSGGGEQRSELKTHTEDAGVLHRLLSSPPAGSPPLGVVRKVCDPGPPSPRCSLPPPLAPKALSSFPVGRGSLRWVSRHPGVCLPLRCSCPGYEVRLHFCHAGNQAGYLPSPGREPGPFGGPQASRPDPEDPSGSRSHLELQRPVCPVANLLTKRRKSII